jgi:DUF971 family protein
MNPSATSTTNPPPSSKPLRPAQVSKIGEELAIAWEGGEESYLPLEFLRRACPCATCGGEPDVLGRVVRPTVEYQRGSFELMRFEFVGGYAIQPRWGDGHSTGIYSWNYLRRLAQVAEE